jgi:predicted amidophosphoribosyltransferase
VLLELVLPQRCVVCGSRRTQLCDRCRLVLPRLRGPQCERCGGPTAWPVRRCRECARRRLAFECARSAVVYDDRVRALVSAWKERGLRRLVPAVAEIVAESLPAPGLPLTFVPADPDRALQRGHRPAAALARELSVLWGAERLDLLTRRVGRRQRGLPLAERRANVRDAFKAQDSPARIVLVDDVYTSGSTVDAAARALKRAGARRVEVVTFARAVRGYYSEYPNLTDAQGGRIATSDEGQERRGH